MPPTATPTVTPAVTPAVTPTPVYDAVTLTSYGYHRVRRQRGDGHLKLATELTLHVEITHIECIFFDEFSTRLNQITH